MVIITKGYLQGWSLVNIWWLLPPVCDKHGSLWLPWWYWHQFYTEQPLSFWEPKIRQGLQGINLQENLLSIRIASLASSIFCGSYSSHADITGGGPLISPGLCSWCSPIADSTWYSFNIMNYGCDFGHMLSLISHLDKSLKVAVPCISLPQSPAVVPQGLRTQKE